GYSFLSPEQVGKKVFSEKFSLSDDPSRLETFPLQRDFMGMPRGFFPLIENGVFKAFTWSQDDADEFNETPSGHTVTHKSLVVGSGEYPAGALEELVAQPRDIDVLYIPFLHYMNIVNPSKALVTGSSRFGALLLKSDGSMVVPYNVRLTQSLLDIFGERVAWISQRTRPFNVSASYGARNPTAIIVPQFMRVNGLEISHSNASY
ncbi:MAG: metallopeptidase TldD-related protein, partial [Anaerolineales bacterium]